MTRPPQESWRTRPARFQKPWQKGKNWEDKQHRADDQIAPTAASKSTAQLQQWALLTANMPQQGLGKNEAEVVERIQRRYGNAVDSHCESFEPPGTNGNSGKRLRSPSPGRPRTTSRAGLGGLDPPWKRRREKSPSPRDSRHYAGAEQQRHTGNTATSAAEDERNEDDYYQSSEWSFPSSEKEGDGVD